ncbi:26S protease regulatory subunit 6B [Dirofilaria immitis]|nr:26S protease regulatory subunit 6B [Dirofilaria immitis]
MPVKMPRYATKNSSHPTVYPLNDMIHRWDKMTDSVEGVGVAHFKVHLEWTFQVELMVPVYVVLIAHEEEKIELEKERKMVDVDVQEIPTDCGTTAREGTTMGLDEPDDYMRYKKLEKQLEHLDVMEEYVKLETRNLEKELLHAQEEVKRIQSVPLVIGQFLEAVDQDHAIVGSTTGSNYFVRVLSILDRELLKPGCSVALHKYSNALVDVLPPEADSTIQMLRADEKPDVSYADIGGLDMQKQEVREAVELPLTHGELYQQIGIDPPRGVLMYGPPGCGKTMLAKAVAAHTTASFIRVVGSEFVQKYLGEGPRMVRDVFRLAKENSPSIIFIDEIDAIATKRFDAQTGADREVQRILLELLNQMDGFDQSTNVKVIMATNRQDTLDPALLRPGRLDRKIEFPMPDRRQKRLIFSTITAKMNLSDEVDMEDFVARPDKVSGADINAICQEAGMHAVRENRYVVLTKDFDKAYKSVIKKDQNDFDAHYSLISSTQVGVIYLVSGIVYRHVTLRCEEPFQAWARFSVCVIVWAMTDSHKGCQKRKCSRQLGRSWR